ncbi:MAG: serine/threonine-protein kinase [Elusimicrobiota bacterium]
MEYKIVSNRYVILEQIGEPGGFGTVYKAWARHLEKFVALKKLHTHLARSTALIEMFHSEAVNTAKLEHENIVRVIDYFQTEEKEWYIVMEYVRGCDLQYLKEKIENEILPKEIGVYIISQILKAEDYAHARIDDLTGQPLGIVHRDISPANIMMYYDGKVKLADFGIAKVLSTTSTGPSYGKREGLRGKFSYMSPEQANNNPNLTAQSDIFSTGLVLYEVLTGKKAYGTNGETEAWTRASQGNIDFKLLDEMQIPEEVIEALHRALQIDLTLRYENAKEMFVDLLRWLHTCDWGNRQGDLKIYLNKLLAREMELEELRTKELLASLSLKNTPAAPQKTPGGTIPRKTTTPQPVAEHREFKEQGIAPEKTGTFKPQSPTLKSSVPEFKTQPKGVQHIPASVPKKSSSREKTVFDYVADTTKKYKLWVLGGISIAVLALLGYVVTDTVLQLTSRGRYLHNIIWAPSFVIDSTPTGAVLTVEAVKGSKKVVVLSGNTPLPVSRLSAGVYYIKLEKQGFSAVEQTVSISKTGQPVSIPGSRVIKTKSSETYVVPFECLVSFKSIPSGAEVYVDKVLLGVKTPVADLPFKTGKHKVEMKYVSSPGELQYESIAAELDFSEISGGMIIDKRFWDAVFNKDGPGGLARFVITGKLKMWVSINSQPPTASVYVDETYLGVTPLERVAIGVGNHTVRIEKYGVDPFEGEFEIGTEGSGARTQFMFNLEPGLYICAKFPDAGNDEKIIVGISDNTGQLVTAETTPYRYKLKPGKYELVFMHPKKKNTVKKRINVTKEAMTINILQDDAPVSVSGSGVKTKTDGVDTKSYIKVQVLETLSGEPIDNVGISINGGAFKSTDNKGIWQGYVSPGKVVIAVGKSGYEIKEVKSAIRAGETKAVTIKLAEQK